MADELVRGSELNCGDQYRYLDEDTIWQVRETVRTARAYPITSTGLDLGTSASVNRWNRVVRVLDAEKAAVERARDRDEASGRYDEGGEG
jgi:hypothetical protein